MNFIVRCAFGFLIAVLPLTASAQTPEKRIALVVGNAAYPDHVLPTSANDGGLIAQTLQAAGFDVAGARDLDAESLRRALRDFVQKAQTSGADTVAVLYLAGYGLQLAGENYFVPVDAAPARDTDVAVDTLRISDYVRQLQALPLKAGIVVLDAARETSFAKGGQPLAGGLALVDPDPKIFTASNAAPGTVARDGSGAYGAYAQALAEMIRTGGLTLPEVFDRTRLRVSEATKGAQIPWDTRTIEARFTFFDRAPDAPQATAALPDRSKPIASYSVNDAFAAALSRDTLADYDAFVAAYPGDPLAKRVRAIIAARREAITWRRSYRVNTPEAYWSYLQRYPRGPHAYDARRRLAFLTAPLAPPPSFATIVYDVPPPPPDEIVYIERPYVVFSDPVFGFAPPPPPPVYFLPPPPPDFVVLAPPPPVIGLFILPRPFFVPIPAYVVAPTYVAPPPNNVIFANIHNTTVINTVINQPAVNNAAPAPGQGAAAAPAAAGNNAGAPALPPSVAQRASLIQQGKIAAPAGVTTSPAVAPATNASPATASAPAAPPSINRAAVGTPTVQPNPAASANPPTTAQTPPQNGAAAKPSPAQQAAPAAKPAAAQQATTGTTAKPTAGPQNGTAPKRLANPPTALAPTASSTPAKPMVAARTPQINAVARPVPSAPARPQPPQIQRPPQVQAMARPAAPRMAPPRGPRPPPNGKPPKH